MSCDFCLTAIVFRWVLDGKFLQLAVLFEKYFVWFRFRFCEKNLLRKSGDEETRFRRGILAIAASSFPADFRCRSEICAVSMKVDREKPMVFLFPVKKGERKKEGGRGNDEC